MRNLLVVLSAAVVGGLSVYFLFSGLCTFGVMGGNVVIGMDVFVAFIAALTIGAAALALSMRHLLLRSEARDLQDLRDRIARLEAAR
ncbi:MAG: hypothetical protein JNM25_14050 [Planctomycetes bacterium]|nr:hypothetical protein [Planctomycetota bacterium]